MKVIHDQVRESLGVEVTCKSCGSSLKLFPEDITYVFGHGCRLSSCVCCGRHITDNFKVPAAWYKYIDYGDD